MKSFKLLSNLNNNLLKKQSCPNIMFQTQSCNFGSIFHKRKTSLKDYDKFNRLPEYKLDQSMNLVQEEGLNGSDYFSSIKNQFNKQRKEYEKDGVEIAKHILRTQREQLLEESNNMYRAGTVYQGAKLTENILLNKRMFKNASYHPEIQMKNKQAKEREFVNKLDNEYGNYSKYFSVEKQDFNVDHDKDYRKNEEISTRKKLENISTRYSVDPKHKRYLQIQSKMVADLVDKNLHYATNDDKHILEFFKKSYKEMKHDKAWEKLFSDIITKTDKKTIYNALIKKIGNDYERNGVWSQDLKYRVAKPEDIVDKEDLVDNTYSVSDQNSRSILNGALGLELDAMNNFNQKEQPKVLSPLAQDELYHLYLDGYPISELSLKYGLLPKSVKFVICQRYVYWNFLYPKIGPLKHYQLMREVDRQKKYRYVDYGAELEEMIYNDSKLHIDMFNLKYKRMKAHELGESVIGALKTERQKRKKFRIPERYIGNKQRGYLVYTEFITRGKAARSVNKQFKHYCLYKDTKPGHCVKGTLNKLFLGPRFASFNKY